jgi:hypothetical protein
MKHMAKELGRKALEEMNMPHPHTLNTSIHLAILGPNLCSTALWGYNTKI